MTTRLTACARPWRLLAAAPWLMLAASALCWLRFGVDMPFVDDWRAYADGTAGQWAPRLWFTATNNTIAPLGLALDALAQRVLGGNVIAYQFITLVLVLGGLLVCQWRLLRWALGDARLAALAFAATAFMLQSGSYWGEQNMAYHQALPLLWLLMALAIGLTSRASPTVVAVAALGLGVLAGLSYISGAVAALVLGGALWVVLAVAAVPGWAKPAADEAHSPFQAIHVQSARALALGLLLAGLGTCALQAWAMAASADSLGSAIPKAWPTQAAFWAYALGKLGRALGLPVAPLGWDALLVGALWLAAVAALAALAVRLVQLALRRTGQVSQANMPDGHTRSLLARVALVALPLAAMLAVYLMLVAHGRANFRDAGVQTSWQVYQFGYGRFHHFWLTLIWPWVIAALAALLAWRASVAPAALAASAPSNQQAVSGALRRIFLPISAILMVILSIGAARSVFNVAEHYRSAAQFRADQWLCLTQQWGSGAPIRCPIFDLPDATGALLYAQHIGASFTRYLPLDANVPGRELARWSFAAGLPQLGTDERLADVQATPTASGHWLRTGSDAQWVLRLNGAATQALAQCQVLDVAVQVQASRAGGMQLFFRPQASTGFSEAQSRTQALQPPAGLAEPDQPLSLHSLNQPAPPAPPPAAGPMQTLHFAWRSETGFAPHLRLDFADQPMWLRLGDVRISCRLPTWAAWRQQASGLPGDAGQGAH